MNISSIPQSQHDDESFLETLRTDGLFFTKTNDMMSDPVGAMSPKFGDEPKKDLSDFSRPKEDMPEPRHRTIAKQYDQRVVIQEIAPDIQEYIEKLKREKPNGIQGRF